MGSTKTAGIPRYQGSVLRAIASCDLAYSDMFVTDESVKVQREVVKSYV
jgi:hypothetical protein